MDLSKVTSITTPKGVVIKIVSGGKTLWQKVTEQLKNWVKYSTEADGITIYNGGLGYMDNYRMNSSGEVKAASGMCHCGYIPVKIGDIIRAKGSTAGVATAGGHYFTIYDASFNRLATYGLNNCTASSFFSATYATQADGFDMFTLDTAKASTNNSCLSNMQKAAYFRISFASCKGVNFIVTVNEEIV